MNEGSYRYRYDPKHRAWIDSLDKRHNEAKDLPTEEYWKIRKTLNAEFVKGPPTNGGD